MKHEEHVNQYGPIETAYNQIDTQEMNIQTLKYYELVAKFRDKRVVQYRGKIRVAKYRVQLFQKLRDVQFSLDLTQTGTIPICTALFPSLVDSCWNLKQKARHNFFNFTK